MATVAATVHRPHAFWVRVLEDLAIVTAIAVVSCLLVGTVRSSGGQGAALFPSTVLGISSPAAGEPLSISAASRPMIDAVKVASALEAKGVFGAEAEAAWQKAAEECRRLAVQPIATGRGRSIMLWLLEAEEGRAEELTSLIATPGKTPEEVEALTVLRAEAIENAKLIRCYRDIVNFDHWKEICEVEASAPGLEAREAAWLATRAAEAGRPAEAREALESSFRSWRAVLDARPVMLHDPLIIADLADEVGCYRTVLAELGGEFPQPFILQDVLDQAESNN